MNDLSKWDFVGTFSGDEAAALIIGIQPADFAHTDDPRKATVLRTLQKSYYPLRDYPGIARNALALQNHGQWIFSEHLVHVFSVDETDEKFRSADRSGDLDFIEQHFSRQEIARWLIARGMRSVYSFNLKHFTNPDAAVETETDPADLPDELQAANIAFRAVTNGYGDKTATFKNRLIDYLEKNFLGLNKEAVQRIATVANPDKTPGRKKPGTD